MKNSINRYFQEVFTDDVKVHETWKGFKGKIKALLKNVKKHPDIQKYSEEKFTPSPKNVLRFLRTDLKKIKIVILGQDPYPQEADEVRAATGRAFEVGTIKCWCDPIPQTSLINIVKTIFIIDKIKKENSNTERIYKQIREQVDKKNISIDLIREQIKSGDFKINCSLQNWFVDLEEQGVLFLNTAFTCNVGNTKEDANVHSAAWQEFTKELIEHLNKENPKIKWFLWGEKAQDIMPEGDKGEEKYYRVCHPRLLDFISSKNGIAETWETINWLGVKYKKNRRREYTTDISKSYNSEGV